jgi:adenosylcobinamide kinase/adenosylcobinamide-phosphate guanylyltransferase
MTCTLVLGGARSGKSAYAEQLARNTGKEVIYIATAHSGDSEMAARIAHHREHRPAEWTTVEEPLQLASVLQALANPQRVILVDCITLWLTNLMFSEDASYPDVGELELPRQFHQQRAALLEMLSTCAGDVILVSNEVGMGIVPFGAISRTFADEAGRLNQALAALCDRAVFVAAGLPLVLKGAAC